MAKTNGGTTKTAKEQMDFINEAVDNFEGFEQINANTMAIPFVRILQSLAPQLNKNKPQFIEDAEEGDWFNTVTKELYGEEIEVIVLKFEHVYIEWLPERGGFVSYHSPENAERLAIDKTFGHWKTEDGNDLQENYAYICMIVGHEEEGIVVMSFSSSAIKMAREWNRLMTTHVMDNGKRALPYYLVWNLKATYTENDKGSWYTPNVSYVGYIDEGQYGLLSKERKALPDRNVDYEQIADSTSEDDGDSDEDPGY
jgi:hypothetical protein